jgi:hypothetical protein
MHSVYNDPQRFSPLFQDEHVPSPVVLTPRSVAVRSSQDSRGAEPQSGSRHSWRSRIPPGIKSNRLSDALNIQCLQRCGEEDETSTSNPTLPANLRFLHRRKSRKLLSSTREYPAALRRSEQWIIMDSMIKCALIASLACVPRDCLSLGV